VKARLAFRTDWAEKIGLGFQLPIENPIKEPIAVDPIPAPEALPLCQPGTFAGDQLTQGENI
jgi:hypothetical protein